MNKVRNKPLDRNLIQRLIEGVFVFLSGLLFLIIGWVTIYNNGLFLGIGLLVMGFIGVLIGTLHCFSFTKAKIIVTSDEIKIYHYAMTYSIPLLSISRVYISDSVTIITPSKTITFVESLFETVEERENFLSCLFDHLSKFNGNFFEGGWIASNVTELTQKSKISKTKKKYV